MKERFISEVERQLHYSFSVNDISLITAVLERVLSDYDIILAKALPERIEVIPDLYTKFIVSKSIEGIKKSSLDNYAHILKDFFENVLKPIPSITADDIRIYLFERHKRNDISRCYLANIRVVIKAFFSWCVKEQYIEKNPVSTIKNIKFVPKKIDPLSEREIEQCRLAYKNFSVRDQAIFEVFYATGCRCQEVCDLTMEQIDFEKRFADIIGKGDKPRRVYFNERSILLLQQYLDSRNGQTEADSNYIFVSKLKPHTKLSVDAMQRIFNRIGTAANIHLHPHKLRHTMATHLVAKGMPVEEVQILLGHSFIQTTMVYAKVCEANIAFHYHKFIS